MTEAHIDMIARASVPKALTPDEIEAATNEDQTLRAVRAAVKLNKWHYDSVKCFKSFKDELNNSNTERCYSSRCENCHPTHLSTTSY